MSNGNNEEKDLTNQTVAGYRVLHRLGRGGMSAVYLAFHENLRRHVAFKVLRQDLVGSSDHQQRFLQEARAAASLIHPNIVQVYDIGQAEQIHFIAQEYIPGTTLRNYIQRSGSLPVPETLSIMLQIAAAIQKASSVGIVHRDIKPENILLTPDGEVKVADFGLARARGQDTSLTDVGVTLGTPLYMSPEQIQGQPIDSRSDLYSLGVTAFHMLAGRPPFEGDTALALAVQHLQNPPPDLSPLRQDVPQELIAIINQLLQKSPDNRISSAATLIRLLREIVDSMHLNWRTDHPLPLANLVVDNQTDLTAKTMRLQVVTLESSKAARRIRTRNLAAIAGSFVFFLSAFAFASSYRREPLLPDQYVQPPDVECKASVGQQYFHALLTDTIPAWRAVEECFPQDGSLLSKSYNVKAWLRLSRAYTRQNELDRARQTLFKILRLEGDADTAMRVLALIQAAEIEAIEGNSERMKELREESKRLYASLPQNRKEFVDKAMTKECQVIWNATDPVPPVPAKSST